MALEISGSPGKPPLLGDTPLEGRELGPCMRWRRICNAVRAEFRQHGKLLPLALAQMLLLADQPLLSTNMSQVAEELRLDEHEKDELLGGLVSVVYFTCGALSSLLAGRLADVMRRISLVRICMLLGSAGTFLNSQASSLGGILLCRGAVGAALGGLLPASFAMLADFYPAEERPHAVALVAIISGVGPGLGQGLAGTMGPAWGWQAPFACVGVCGFSLSLLLFGYLREPPGMDKVEDAGDRNQLCGTWVRDLRIPTVVLICLQGITGCVPWAVINTFLTDYLAQNGGLGVLRATGVFLSFGIGCTTGTVLGGKLGQFLYKKDKGFQAALMAATTWIGMVPIFILFAIGDGGGQCWLFHLLALTGGVLVAGTGGNAKAILLNTVPVKSRGSLFGVYTIMDDLGKGLGPALVASWVRALGRRVSFMIGISFWLPCGLFCWKMIRTVRLDDKAEIGSPASASTRTGDSSAREDIGSTTSTRMGPGSPGGSSSA